MRRYSRPSPRRSVTNKTVCRSHCFPSVCPLAFLRSRREDAEALLFGIAGFLDAPDLDAQRKSTRGYLRSLWDRWWKYREQFSRLVLPAKLWKMSGARPLNHPHRRLGALATVVAEWKPFSTLARASEATPLISFLADLRHDFWNHHYTLAAARASSPLALIGKSRAAEILANVVYPRQSMTTAKSGMITKITCPTLQSSGAYCRGTTVCRRSAATRLRRVFGRTTGITPNLRGLLPARCLRLRELSATGTIAPLVILLPLARNSLYLGDGLLTFIVHPSPFPLSQCGCSSMVERQLPKLDTRVRFPSPACR